MIWRIFLIVVGAVLLCVLILLILKLIEKYKQTQNKVDIHNLNMEDLRNLVHTYPDIISELLKNKKIANETSETIINTNSSTDKTEVQMNTGGSEDFSHKNTDSQEQEL